MKQLIEAVGTPVPASVKVGTIFSWATLFAIVTNLKNRLPEPWRDAIPEKSYASLAQEEINAHLCSVTVLYIGTASERAKDNRRDSRFYYNPLYISLICMDCDKFGLYRTDFFIHLIVTVQMKQLKSAAGIIIPASVKAGTIFSWATLFAIVMNMKNRLPELWQDVIPVENMDDLKTVVKLSAILLAAFIMASIYNMLLLQEGGLL